MHQLVEWLPLNLQSHRSLIGRDWVSNFISPSRISVSWKCQLVPTDFPWGMHSIFPVRHLPMGIKKKYRRSNKELTTASVTPILCTEMHTQGCGGKCYHQSVHAVVSCRGQGHGGLKHYHQVMVLQCTTAALKNKRGSVEY